MCLSLCGNTENYEAMDGLFRSSLKSCRRWNIMIINKITPPVSWNCYKKLIHERRKSLREPSLFDDDDDDDDDDRSWSWFHFRTRRAAKERPSVDEQSPDENTCYCVYLSTFKSKMIRKHILCSFQFAQWSIIILLLKKKVHFDIRWHSSSLPYASVERLIPGIAAALRYDVGQIRSVFIKVNTVRGQRDSGGTVWVLFLGPK